MTIPAADRPQARPTQAAPRAASGPARRRSGNAVVARRRTPIAAGNADAVAADVMAVLAAFGLED